MAEADAELKREEAMAKDDRERQIAIWAHDAKMEEIRLAHEAKLIEIDAQRELAKEAKESKEGDDSKISKAISKIKMPDVHIHQGGKKKITLPGGKTAIVENE